MHWLLTLIGIIILLLIFGDAIFAIILAIVALVTPYLILVAIDPNIHFGFIVLTYYILGMLVHKYLDKR